MEILDRWCEKYGHEYNGVYLHTNASSGRLHGDERSATHWSPGHFQHVIRLREDALNFGRKMWADYLFVRSFFLWCSSFLLFGGLTM